MASNFPTAYVRVALQTYVLQPYFLVHPVVDDGVDTGIGHGQPVEGEVDVADVGYLGDGGVVVGVDEVDVVGRPADHEDTHHHGEHLHYLPNIHKSAFQRVFCKDL